jgi:Rrf2 family protein
MRLALDRRSEYAMRAVLDVASQSDPVWRKKQEIGEATGVPLSYLAHILAALVQARILVARSGPSGGYGLRRPGERITLLEIIEALEGPINAENCVLRGGTCNWAEPCALHDAWTRAQEAIASELQRTTVAEVLSEMAIAG